MNPIKIKCEFCGEGHLSGEPMLLCELKSLRTRLAESEKGREHDREQFRNGVDAWQKRIRKAVKRIWGLRAKSASDKDCIAFVESDAVYARGEWRKAEKTIRKAEEQVILLLEQVGSLRGKLADAEKRARDNGDQAAAHLEDLQGLRRKAQLHKEAKWDAEKRLASVEKCVRAARAFKGKIVSPKGAIILDGKLIKEFLGEIPKERCAPGTLSSAVGDNLAATIDVPVHKCDRCGTQYFEGTVCLECVRSSKE